MIKNKNWHNNKRTLKTNKYLEEQVRDLRRNTPRFEKVSFIGFDKIQNLVETPGKMELDNEIDFFAKDVRRKNISLFNITGQHFMFDR